MLWLLSCGFSYTTRLRDENILCPLRFSASKGHSDGFTSQGFDWGGGKPRKFLQIFCSCINKESLFNLRGTHSTGGENAANFYAYMHSLIGISV